MGWDAFGLPAEQHAKKTGTHPRTTTEKNIANFRRQLKMLGFSYDWDRELATTDVDYFRWTQFIFLVLFDTWFDESQQRGRPIAELPIPEEVAEEGEEAVERYRDEHRLAYQLEAPVNWCPALGTVLANEEVIGGVSERGGHPVVRIAAAAVDAADHRLRRPARKRPRRARLAREHQAAAAQLDRPQHRRRGRFLHRHDCRTKTASRRRRNTRAGWPIASTAGWPRKPDEQVLRIYTTRPDTLFGATYMVIAPEHPFVERLTTPEQADGGPRVLRKAGPQERPRPHRSGQGEDRRLHRLVRDQSGQRRGDSDLGGRLRADQLRHRGDHGRAGPRHPRLRVRQAVRSADHHGGRSGRESPVASGRGAGGEGVSAALTTLSRPGRVAFIADGTAINSGPYNGLTTPEFKQKIAEDLAEQGHRPRGGQLQAPRLALQPAAFLGRAVPDPARTGRRRQADRPDPRAGADRPAAGPAGEDGVRRQARRADAAAGQGPARLALRDARRQALQARDEHHAAMGRLVLVLSAVPRSEERQGPGRSAGREGVDAGRSVRRRGGTRRAAPALRPILAQGALRSRLRERAPSRSRKLVNQGMILGRERTRKMSKEPRQRGQSATKVGRERNTGADALRLYEMFMGPLEAVKPWSMDGVSGVRGFLDRAWRMIIDDRAEAMQLNAAVQDVEPTAEQNRMLHKTIKAVTNDLEQMSFNTAIARMMEFTNFFLKAEVRPQVGDGAVRAAALAVRPAHGRGALAGAGPRTTTLAYEPWPTFDEAAIREDTIEVPVQINGKLRGRIQVPAEIDKAALEAAARADAEDRRAAGRQDGRQGDRGAGPDGQFRGEIDESVKRDGKMPQPIFIFKVALAGRKSIWRKIAMRGNQTLDDLHEAIFDAFDRYDEHLYSFYFPAAGHEETDHVQGARLCGVRMPDRVRRRRAVFRP